MTDNDNEFDPMLIEKASQNWHNRWDKLVSRTNWEKGLLILQWRQELIEVGAPQNVYSDDAWSKMVGNVSPQHVGRLRRVQERFGNVSEQYPELYWSHFQAALDWDDALDWLQSAVENYWSVSKMRSQRWEMLGITPDSAQDAEIQAEDVDEDVDPANELPPNGKSTSDSQNGKSSKAGQESDDSDDKEKKVHASDAQVKDFSETFGNYGPGDTGPDFGDERDIPFDPDGKSAVPNVEGSDDGKSMFAPPKPPIEPVRPFEDMSEMPQDLADAFDCLKLAIIRQKLSSWQEISVDDVCAALNAMKELARAPS